MQPLQQFKDIRHKVLARLMLQAFPNNLLLRRITNGLSKDIIRTSLILSQTIIHLIRLKPHP
jgi:hypothetical protein